MTMHRFFHNRDDVHRLHVSGKDGGRGIVIIEDSIDTSIQQLEDYIEKCGGGVITALRNSAEDTMINQKTKIGKKTQLYRGFQRLTSNISHENIWTWLTLNDKLNLFW